MNSEKEIINASDHEKIEVRLTQSDEEIRKAQSIRYSVFYEEYGATASLEILKEKRDFDGYDDFADHLIVIDKTIQDSTESIIGTYRLLRYEQAQKKGQFYTSDEFDITPLLPVKDGLLELGRSCVLPPYRTRPVLQTLWRGIAHYLADNNIDLMFGCASLHGTDVNKLSEQLAYLHHYHLADKDQCPVAVKNRYVDMNLHAKDDLDAKRVFSSLPPLIKGYLRLGATIGEGAIIDEEFNTIDVCIVLPTGAVTQKYVKHYERVTNKTMPTFETAKSKESL
ncbi:MAG: GNAT family N-acyltransferase [Pseudomonadota bacterium]